jgi:phospholipid/cholesterol/gamma-HCH transport system substrate-binding protein
VGLFLIGNSNQLFTKSFTAYSDFAKVTGIQQGGKVRVAGMDAGTVTRIQVPLRPGDRFRVYFRIIEKLHPIVRQDSVASIQTDGLLGSKYVQVEAGTSQARRAENNGRILSVEPFDWGDLMDQINGAVQQVNGILTGVKEQLTVTLKEIEGVTKQVNQIVTTAKPQVKSILASADKAGANLRAIIDGLQKGEGTIGGLLKDQELYDSVKRSANQSEQIVESVRGAAAQTAAIVKSVEEAEIVPEVQRAVKNLQAITLQVKDALEKFEAASGEGGAGESFQKTLADAHEAMSDLSDNTEALKHSFFFRGFFKKRGFFDLGTLTLSEYRSPAFGKGFKQHRAWLESSALFVKDAKGLEVLTTEGKTLLDEAMTVLLRLPRNGPLVIEGLFGTGTAAQQFLGGQRRANRVEAYIVDRFRLRPAYVGSISLGAQPSEQDGNATKEGVSIVSFYK